MEQKQQPDFMDMLREFSTASSKGGSLPGSSVIRNLDVVALGSKLVRAPAQEASNAFRSDRVDIPVIASGIEQIVRNSLRRTEEAENIFVLFPDITLAAEIVVASIISPKDMMRSSLIFKAENSFLPAATISQMIETVKEEINQEYGLEEDLVKILNQALFRSGSFVRVILPEAAVDYIINGNKTFVAETVFNSGIVSRTGDIPHLGLFGNASEPSKVGGGKKVWSFESVLDQHREAYDATLSVPDFTTINSTSDEDSSPASVINFKAFGEAIKNTVTVHDNYQFLKMPLLNEAVKENRQATILGDQLAGQAFSFENAAEEIVEGPDTYKGSAEPTPKGKMSRDEFERLMYKSSSATQKPFIRIPSKNGLKRRSVGRGLKLDIPSSSVIPIYHAGDPSAHIGYLVPTDFDGNFITEESPGYKQISASTYLDGNRTSSGIGSYLTDKARQNLTDDEYVPIISAMSEIVADITEADIAERLSRGSIGKGYKVANVSDVYRIMVTRVLKGQYTRLIFIPAEYVTYFAFDYAKNGTGVSYLDGIRNIASLRATTTFATVANLLKSAITVTHCEVEISENDPDPQRTAEKARHFVSRTRQSYFPHGLRRIVDLSEWMQKAGIEMSFKGNSKLPKTSMNFEARQPSRPIPTDTMDERFRHQMYMHFGLSPDQVDSAAKTEFATVFESNNILFSRRISILADTFSRLLTRCSTITARNDMVILKKLRKIVLANKEDILSKLPEGLRGLAERDTEGFTDFIVEKFLSVLVVDLPRAESRKLDNVGKAYDDKVKEIENALSYVLTPEALPADFGGDVTAALDALRGAVKAQIMREWMAENGYGEEALRYAKVDEDEKPMIDLAASNKSFVENVAKTCITWLQENKDLINAIRVDLGEARGEGSEGSGEGEESSPSAAPSPFDAPVVEEEEPESDTGSSGGESPFNS